MSALILAIIFVSLIVGGIVYIIDDLFFKHQRDSRMVERDPRYFIDRRPGRKD